MTYKHNIVNYKIVNYNKSQAKHRLISSSRPFWHSPPSIANPWIEVYTVYNAGVHPAVVGKLLN